MVAIIVVVSVINLKDTAAFDHVRWHYIILDIIRIQTGFITHWSAL